MHVKFCYNLLFFIFKSSLNSPQITKVENLCPLTKNLEHFGRIGVQKGASWEP